MIASLIVWIMPMAVSLVGLPFIEKKGNLLEGIPCAFIPGFNVIFMIAVIISLYEQYESNKSTEVVYESVVRSKLKIHTVEGIKCYVADGKLHMLPQNCQNELYNGELFKVVRNGKVFIEHVKE